MPYNGKLKTKVSILANKTRAMLDTLKKEIETKDDDYEILDKVDRNIREFFKTPNSPSIKKRYMNPNEPPIKEDINKTLREVYQDFSVIHSEVESLSRDLKSDFNYTQTSKEKMKNEIKELRAMLKEYKLLAETTKPGVMHITEDFNNKSKIDKEFSSSMPADVSTDEGTVTLAKSTSVEVSKDSVISNLRGNGEKGRKRLVNHEAIEDYSGIISNNMLFDDEDDVHDNEEVMVDGQPSTWFEYQMIDLPEEVKNKYPGYKFDWAKDEDRLRLRIVVELPREKNINWVIINPYIPPKFPSGEIIVHSISTSVDGSYFEPIDTRNTILNKRIEIFPDYQDVDELGEDFNKSKFAGQGVWNFPQRKAKFIEIVLDQEEPYKEDIGIIYYTRVREIVNTRGEIEEISEIVTEDDVPSELQEAPPGKYSISSNSYIIKDINVEEAYRYVIGIRDISAYKYEFEDKSELTTTPFSTDAPIRAVTLSANERIPQEMLELVEKRNEWIKYYISFDDVNWHQISPLHHESLGEDEIPPKVYLINTDINPTNHVHRETLSVEDNQIIRLKIVFTRPDDSQSAPSFTPVLEDYSLNLHTETD